MTTNKIDIILHQIPLERLKRQSGIAESQDERMIDEAMPYRGDIRSL